MIMIYYYINIPGKKWQVITFDFDLYLIVFDSFFLLLLLFFFINY